MGFRNGGSKNMYLFGFFPQWTHVACDLMMEGRHPVSSRSRDMLTCHATIFHPNANEGERCWQLFPSVHDLLDEAMQQK